MRRREFIVALAGAVEPLARPGERSRRITWHDLAAADPHLIVIACCGFTAGRARRDLPAFLARPEVSALPCVRAGRIVVADGNAYFSRPGPRLVDSLEVLVDALASHTSR